MEYIKKKNLGHQKNSSLSPASTATVYTWSVLMGVHTRTKLTMRKTLPTRLNWREEVTVLLFQKSENCKIKPHLPFPPLPPMLLLYSQLQDILIRGCRHGESPYGAGILVGTWQRKKRHIKHQLGNVPSTYKLQPAEIPVRRDFTGSRAGHLFPVLKQQRLSEWVITNQADQLDLKQEKGKQQTHCAANTHDPNTKQRNVTWDLNDCLIFSVRFHGFANEIFPDVLKPQKFTGHSCLYAFPSSSTPLKTPWH